MSETRDIDRGFKDIKRELTRLQGMAVSVGFQGQTGSEPAGDGFGEATIADVAIFNEFGTVDIPERPFMRIAFDGHQGDIADFIEARVADVLDRKLTANQAASQVGIFFASLVQRTITEAAGWAAPNAPETIEQKGSSSPLIDTGQMRQSVTWVVKRGEEMVAEGVAA